MRLEVHNDKAPGIQRLPSSLRVDPSSVTKSQELLNVGQAKVTYVPQDGRLRATNPSQGLSLLPIPLSAAGNEHQFALYLSSGHVSNSGSYYKPSSPHFTVTVHYCSPPPPGQVSPVCKQLEGTVQKLPNPKWGSAFPAKVGASEADEVIMFQAKVPASGRLDDHIGVFVAENAASGWLVAGFDSGEEVQLPVSKTGE